MLSNAVAVAGTDWTVPLEELLRCRRHPRSCEVAGRTTPPSRQLTVSWESGRSRNRWEPTLSVLFSVEIGFQDRWRCDPFRKTEAHTVGIVPQFD